ncbi:L-threonine ammonia-lyase-like isoform X2 [Daphnia carinata]|uniref:L-threonine ammonia-lyase-like isoform X2 n=1 Tax=Daphnia carinata TaxID=120202 RepID=UPI00257AEE2A|nr:L-threonine ammonia-lyase-like isoform X2 [Daphnia carinata]
MSSHMSSKDRRQYFVSHVTTSHKSVDFADYDSSATIIDGQVANERGSTPSTSPTCDADSLPSSAAINGRDPIAAASQSPFCAAQKVETKSPAALKSIIKYPQQTTVVQPQREPVQHQQSIEFELIQPATRTQLDCELVFTSERISQQPEEEPPKPPTVISTANINMSNNEGSANQQPPAISVNGNEVAVNGSDPSDLFDPWCDPNRPRIVQFQDISAAAFKIKSGIMVTPCTRSHLSNLTGTQIFFKKDFLQYTGSFKERGARYTLLMLPEANQKQGVCTASAGNHALALSYHGQELGIPVTVVMPIVAPIMKVQSCRQFGANIIIHGRDIGESREYAMRLAKEKGLTYINGYDHPHIIAGQGTMGLEIVEQVKNVDAVVVPVGGGGLIAGVALAVKSLYPHIQVIGVESERCASFSSALKVGQPIYTKADSTLADGLAVPKVGINSLATAAPLVDKCVVVKEEYIAMAILRLVEIEKAVVEGAGACGLAAILAGLLPELKGKRVVIPLCGGNIDTTVLGRCLERGLAVDGRLVKFSVTVSDRPGGIAELCRLMANLGVSIKDILHERAWLKSDIFSVEVRVMCETRDVEHAVELERALKEHYNNVHFGKMADALGGSGLTVDEVMDSRSPLI